MKRLASTALSSSEDKKARREAGLDLDLSRDITDLQVEGVLKEVSAPSPIQQQITEWLTKITEFLIGVKFPKYSRDKILALSSNKEWNSLPPDFKFGGGKVVEAVAVGPLAASALVFPGAVGTIRIRLQFKKQSKDAEESRNYCLTSLLSLASSTASSPLVDSSSLVYRSWSSLPDLEITPSNAKINKHLSILLSVCDEEENHGVKQSLQEELNRLMTTNLNYRCAAQLLEIWTRQLKSLLPVNLLPVIFLHCHLTNQLTSAMKPWQAVRRIWTLIAATNLSDQQLILGVEKPVPCQSKTSPFLDRDGTTSLFPDLPLSQWRALSQWSAGALSVGVKESLLVRQNICALYDTVLVLQGAETLDPCRLLLDLEYALDDRITRISGVNPVNLVGRFYIGLSLDPTTYFHPATHGPQADHPDAKKFREFWGERSELRRFQDGVVKEVVVWGNRREEIIGDLVRAVVARHHPGLDVVEKGNWHGNILVGDGGEAARKELDVLTPVLYGLEGLALSVSGVSGFGEEFRLSRVGTRTAGWKVGGKTVKEKGGVAVLREKAGMAPQHIQCLDVMLQAEHSGKWPKNEDAVRRLRVAWLHEVGKALSKQVEGLRHRIIGEGLMVVTPSRAVVLRFSVGEKGKGEIGHLCQLSSWLAGVAQTNPAWSGGVRLAKRWVSSHLLAGAIPDTAVELLMARVFLNSAEFGSAPVSPVSAFYRWLQLVSSHDWNEAPVVVSPEMDFTEARATLPPLAVISPHDPSPSYWTSPGPSWAELQRLVNLAAHSLRVAEEKVEKEEMEVVRKIFSPSLDSYEFLIELKPLQVPNRYLNIIKPPLTDEKSGKSEKTEKERSSCIPVVEFHPAVHLLKELTQSYSHLAKFYLDKYGGTLIAVKLKQNTKSRVKVSELAGHMSRGQETEVNWGAVVEDWRILGLGIVKRIECQNTELFI